MRPITMISTTSRRNSSSVSTEPTSPGYSPATSTSSPSHRLSSVTVSCGQDASESMRQAAKGRIVAKAGDALSLINPCQALLKRIVDGHEMTKEDSNAIRGCVSLLSGALEDIVSAHTAASQQRSASVSAAHTARSTSTVGKQRVYASTHKEPEPTTLSSAPSHAAATAQDIVRDQEEDWFERRRRMSRNNSSSSHQGGSATHAVTATSAPPPQGPTASGWDNDGTSWLDDVTVEDGSGGAVTDPLRDQPVDWFDLVNQTHTTPHKPSATPVPTAPTTKVSPVRSHNPNTPTQGSFDHNRDQNVDWFERRRGGGGGIGRRSVSGAQAEAAEQERLRLEAKAQEDRKMLTAARAAEAFVSPLRRQTSSSSSIGWGGASSSRNGRESSEPTTPASPYNIPQNLLVKPAAEHWKTTIKLKKAREEAAELKARLDAEAAEATKWSGVPEWKRRVIEEKRRRKAEEMAPALAAQRAKEEADRKFYSLPGWKQKLILAKKNGEFD